MVAKPDMWGRGYRVFISHSTEQKLEATNLKESLKVYGISAFVAHEDIHPTSEWQKEIEDALMSMQALITLLTKEFRDSLWTDQEVGYALCRKVPIVPFRRGIDPYGFLGRFQGLSCEWEQLPLEVIKVLLDKDRSIVDDYLGAIEQCGSFDDGNRLAGVLDSVKSLTSGQAERLRAAYNGNHQVSQSFGFNGSRLHTYGPGLTAHLERLTGGKHQIVHEDDLPW